MVKNLCTMLEIQECNPLQYSWLENPTDRGAWRATVYGTAESQTRLSSHTHTSKSCHLRVAGTLDYSQVRQKGKWPRAPASIWSEGGHVLNSEPLNLWPEAHSRWVRVQMELNSTTPYWCLWRSRELVGFRPPYFSPPQSLAMGSAYPLEISF